MISLVQPRVVALVVMPLVPRARFEILPLSANRLAAWQGRPDFDRLMLRHLVRPIGLWARLWRRHLRHKLARPVTDMIMLSLPDDPGDEPNTPTMPRARAIRMSAEFLPRLILETGLSPDALLSMTLRDLIWLARVANTHSAERFHMDAAIAGRRVGRIPQAELDSRWAVRLAATELDADTFARLQSRAVHDIDDWRRQTRH